jgi:hypothetical protein
VTEFNEDLHNTKLFSLSEERRIKCYEHYSALKERISELEKPRDGGDALFIPINDSIIIKNQPDQ